MGKNEACYSTIQKMEDCLCVGIWYVNLVLAFVLQVVKFPNEFFVHGL